MRCFASQAAPDTAKAGFQLPPCDFVPPPYTGPSKDEVLRLRKQFMNPGQHAAILLHNLYSTRWSFPNVHGG